MPRTSVSTLPSRNLLICLYFLSVFICNRMVPFFLKPLKTLVIYLLDMTIWFTKIKCFTPNFIFTLNINQNAVSVRLSLLESSYQSNDCLRDSSLSFSPLLKYCNRGSLGLQQYFKVVKFVFNSHFYIHVIKSLFSLT